MARDTDIDRRGGRGNVTTNSLDSGKKSAGLLEVAQVIVTFRNLLGRYNYNAVRFNDYSGR